MVEVLGWDPVERTLWGVALTIIFASSIIYLIKGKRMERHDEKIFLYGFTSYIIGYALYFLAFYLFSLSYSGTYINNALYVDFDQGFTPEHMMIYVFGEIAYSIGFGIFFFTFELIHKQTKYLLTFIQSGLLLFRIFLPSLSGYSWLLIFIYSNISTMFIFFYLTRISRLEFKAVSSLLLFGLILFGVSIILFNGDLRTLNIAIFLPLSPILCILGGLISLSPIVIKSEFLVKAKHYWITIGVICLSLICIVMMLFLYALIVFEFSLFILTELIFGFLLVTVLLLMLNKILTSIKKQVLLDDTLENEVDKSNLLGIFTKPRKITEEEVSISKEKGICLVCKGEVGRITYICPECKALYCNKCSKALSSLENMCWVCETPFDESKPVKRIKQESERELIDIEKKKFNY